MSHMHNPYVAAAASAAGNNHTGSGNHVMSGQVPDVHKRDKDAIYGHPLFPFLKNANSPHVPHVTPR